MVILLTLNKTKKLAVLFHDFEQVKRLGCDFVDFEQVKKLSGYFADFEQVKTFATPLGESGCLGNSYFTYWLPKHPVFWFTLTQSVRLPMVTYPSLCSPCVTYGTLCHAIGHQVLPTQPLPREAEDFPRGDNHSKHVPLPTYLAWLQPIYYNSRFVFILVKTVKILLVVKTLIKIT